MPKPFTNEDGEVRELTLAEMKRLRPIAKVDPGMVEAVARLRERHERASRAIDKPQPEMALGSAKTRPDNAKASTPKSAVAGSTGADAKEPKGPNVRRAKRARP